MNNNTVYIEYLKTFSDDFIDFLNSIKIKSPNGSSYSKCDIEISRFTDYRNTTIVPFISDFQQSFQDKFDLFNNHVIASPINAKHKIIVSSVNNVVIYTKFFKYYFSIFLNNFLQDYLKKLFSDVNDISHIDDDSENTYYNRVVFIINKTIEILNEFINSLNQITTNIDSTQESIHETNSKIGNLVSFMAMRNTIKANVDFDNLQFIKYYSDNANNTPQGSALKTVIEKNYTSTTQIMNDISVELEEIYDNYVESIKSVFLNLNNFINSKHAEFQSEIDCCTPESIDAYFDNLSNYIDSKIINRVII